MSNKVKLKEYEVLEIRGYIVHAFDEKHALRKYGNYDYVSEGDVWEQVRELGVVPADDSIAYYG